MNPIHVATPSFRLHPSLALIAICVLGSLGGCESYNEFARGGRARDKADAKPNGVNTNYDGQAAAVGGSPTGADGTVDLQQGQTALAAGNYDAALSAFERAIEDNPRLTPAYLGAGQIYQQKGDYPNAEKTFGKAAELEPSNFDAQYGHGLALQFLNRLSDSVSAYLRALTIKPNDYSANLNLGTAYLQLGEAEQGLSFARRAVELDATSSNARINLGAIYSAMGRHDDAVVEYQQASELTELSPPLLLNLAESLGKTGRYGEMVNTLEQLTAAKPTAIGFERLGMGLFRLKRYSESLTAFRKSVEIDPNHFPALNGIGVCLANQYEFSGREDDAARKEAMVAWRRSLQLERNQARILELLTRYQ